MSFTVPAATARIGRELVEAETAIEQALVATTALMHSAALARAHNPQVDPACGHAAMVRMHKTYGELLAARGDMLRVHGSLRRDAREYAGADEPTCPEEHVFVGAELAEVDGPARAA